MVVTSGGGGFAGASSYGSSGPHLICSRPGSCFGCFLRFRRDFHGLRERQLLFLLTEHGLQDGFIVDGADEADPHRLVQWILDGWEVACGCHLWDTIAASSVGVSPGFLLIVLQNLYRTLTVNLVGGRSDLT